MEIDLAEVRAELRETLRKSQLVEVGLGKKLIHRSDDEQIVTATANGHGDLVDIQIAEDALRYPSKLGAQITSAQ
jgi:DNA-binding protein YbaB